MFKTAQTDQMAVSRIYQYLQKQGLTKLAILTVSDHVRTGAATDPEERERTFDDMVRMALRTLQIDGS